MADRDPLERAAASVLAEPIPAALSAAAVERRAHAIRRRHRVVTTAAACVVLLLIGVLALGVRRPSSVSVTVDVPAGRVISHTYRYRFVDATDEATRRATVERIRARYAALGHEVTAELLSTDELSITDDLPVVDSSRVVEALTFVGATSLHGITRDVGVPAPPDPSSTVGEPATCPTGARPQWEPLRKLLAGCFAVSDDLVVDAGDGALATDVALHATAASGTMQVQVRPSLQDTLAALQAACSARAPACPLGTVALVLDETVAGVVPAPASPVAPGSFTMDGLFNEQVGPWLGAILRTGKLPAAVVPVGAETTSTTGR